MSGGRAPLGAGRARALRRAEPVRAQDGSPGPWSFHPAGPRPRRRTMPGDRLCTPTFLTPSSFSSASKLLPSCASERLVAP
jgi:hypothetical protein